SSLLSNDTSLTDTIQRQKMGLVERLRRERRGSLNPTPRQKLVYPDATQAKHWLTLIETGAAGCW
uniref:hypothetical protein n=1 Tax=uncultured Halomonas sp. TaxID=173971 RepID=UPI00261D257D